MIAAVDFTETAGIDMSVYLRGADVGVAEHFLYRPYVGAALKHMGSETMSQNMRRDPVSCYSDGCRPFADNLENALTGERLTEAGEKCVTGKSRRLCERRTRG